MGKPVAVAVLCVLAGCSTSWKTCHRHRPAGQSVEACELAESDRRHLGESQLRYLGAEDLACPHAALALIVMERRNEFPTVVVASGCGREAVYTRRLRHHQGVLTTERTVWVREGLPREAQLPAVSTAALPSP